MAISFDGYSSKVVVDASTVLDNTSDYSVNFKIKLTDLTAGFERALSYREGSRGFMVVQEDDRLLIMGNSTSGTLWGRSVDGANGCRRTPALAVDTWYNITVNFSGGTAGVLSIPTVWVDGVDSTVDGHGAANGGNDAGFGSGDDTNTLHLGARSAAGASVVTPNDCIIAEVTAWQSHRVIADAVDMTGGDSADTIDVANLALHYEGLDNTDTTEHINSKTVTFYGTVVNATHPTINSGGDVTAPVITLPTITSIGTTSATPGFTTDEDNGTAWWRILPSADPAPSAASLQTLTGTLDGSFSVSATGLQSAGAVTGLSTSTAYKVHFVHVDAAGNGSNVLSSAEFTTSAITTVTKVVDAAGGGDYLTLAAWLAAEKKDLVAAGENHVLEIAAGSYTEFLTISGTDWTTGPSNTLTIKAVAGDEHNGVPGTGVVITGRLSIYVSDVVVQDIEIFAETTNVYGIYFTKSLTLSRVIVISVNTSNTGAAIYAGGFASTAKDSTLIDNCIADGGYRGFVLARGCSLRNSIAIGGTRGLSYSAQGLFENCIVIDGTGLTTLADDSYGNTNNIFNKDVDLTFSAISLELQTATDILTDHANNDYTLKAGSPAIGYGVDRSSYFTEDITNTTITSWDAGASQYVAGDVTAPILSLPTTTDITETTVTLGFTTDEANGIGYWLIKGSGEPVPSVAEIKAGGGNAAVSAIGIQTFVAVGVLIASTEYVAYFVHTDVASNDSTVLASAAFTTQALSPANAVASFVMDDAILTATAALIAFPPIEGTASFTMDDAVLTAHASWGAYALGFFTMDDAVLTATATVLDTAIQLTMAVQESASDTVVMAVTPLTTLTATATIIEASGDGFNAVASVAGAVAASAVIQEGSLDTFQALAVVEETIVVNFAIREEADSVGIFAAIDDTTQATMTVVEGADRFRADGIRQAVPTMLGAMLLSI